MFKPTSATNVAQSMSGKLHSFKKKSFFAKGEAPTKGLVEGNKVAVLMKQLYNSRLQLTKFPVLDGLAGIKVLQIVEKLDELFPGDLGWTATPEVTYKNTNHVARVDVMMQRGNEIRVIEVKTSRVIKPSHIAYYTKKTTFRKGVPASSTYEDHQRQLSVGVRLVKEHMPDANVSGLVLFCGGTLLENVFVKCYNLDPLIENDPLLTDKALDYVTIFRNTYTQKAHAPIFNIRKELQTQCKDSATHIIAMYSDNPTVPVSCAIGENGIIYGVHSYLTPKEPEEVVRQALEASSPCRHILALFLK